MNSNKLTNKNVKDERFTFAHENIELHDHKLKTKARGYFVDAFSVSPVIKQALLLQLLLV